MLRSLTNCWLICFSDFNYNGLDKISYKRTQTLDISQTDEVIALEYAMS